MCSSWSCVQQNVFASTTWHTCTIRLIMHCSIADHYNNLYIGISLSRHHSLTAREPHTISKVVSGVLMTNSLRFQISKLQTLLMCILLHCQSLVSSVSLDCFSQIQSFHSGTQSNACSLVFSGYSHENQAGMKLCTHCTQLEFQGYGIVIAACLCMIHCAFWKYFACSK